MLAELLELAPSGVEEAVLKDGTVEYAVYGAVGELPAMPALTAAAGGALIEVRSEQIADDWDQRWREFHRPLVLGDRLTVRPPWEPRTGGTRVDVMIDPGQAFGTGAHPTTSMCLELLWGIACTRRVNSPTTGSLGGISAGSLVDVGCGSGVLAITAAKLGFDPVLAVDLESAAVEATRRNADVNGVTLAGVRRFDLRREDPPAASTVVANLTGPLLLMLASRVPAEARDVVVSGLLEAEAERVTAAFLKRGLHIHERRAAGGWCAVSLGRLQSLPDANRNN